MRSRIALALVALAALAALAGCSAAGSLDMQAVDGPELADRASRSVDSLDHPLPESDRRPASVVRAAIDDGSATVTAPSPPVDRGLPFERDGAYYNVTWTVTDERSATMVSLAVDYNATDTDGDAVAFEDLPAPDREALDSVLPPSTTRRVPGPDVGVGATYTDAELNASVLAPSPEYDVVVYEGTRYRVTVGEPRDVTVRTYRYEATRVAPDAAAYAAHLRETYAFTMTGLDDAERDVVAEAIDGSYYAQSDDDAAFASVVDRFRERRAVTRDSGTGTYLVRYDGRLYLADVRFGTYAGE